MLKFETYTRKPFEAVAILVTKENMQEVAEWCGGTIELSPGHSNPYIKVRKLPKRHDGHAMAYIGYWVLQSGNQWKVYSDQAFQKSFDKKLSFSGPEYCNMTQYTIGNIPCIKLAGHRGGKNPTYCRGLYQTASFLGTLDPVEVVMPHSENLIAGRCNKTAYTENGTPCIKRAGHRMGEGATPCTGAPLTERRDISKFLDILEEDGYTVGVAED